MTIRTMLVPIPVDDPKESVIASAAGVAKAANAHLVGLAARSGNREAERTAVAAAHVAQPRHAAALARAAEDRIETASHGGEAIKERFQSICAEHGVSFREDDEPDADRLPSASWVEADGGPDEIARRHAPAYDLVVAGSGAVGRFEHDLARASLRSSGRPVLLAPVRFDGEFGGKVVIAWDGSPECWRTVAAAIPLLERASRVTALTVNGGAGNSGAAGRLDRYLAWHGIESTAKTVNPGVRKTDDAILSETSELGADLLVMGAHEPGGLGRIFGRSVATAVLGRVAATPVLMAH